MLINELDNVAFKIIRRNLPNPMGIAVQMGWVYWVDRNLQTVFKASKLPGNTSQPIPVRTSLQKLRDIAIYDVNNQPADDANPCRRLGIVFFYFIWKL